MSTENEPDSAENTLEKLREFTGSEVVPDFPVNQPGMPSYDEILAALKANQAEMKRLRLEVKKLAGIADRVDALETSVFKHYEYFKDQIKQTDDWLRQVADGNG